VELRRIHIGGGRQVEYTLGNTADTMSQFVIGKQRSLRCQGRLLTLILVRRPTLHTER
jgi:hypothetical protein